MWKYAAVVAVLVGLSLTSVRVPLDLVLLEWGLPVVLLLSAIMIMRRLLCGAHARR